MSQYNVAYPGTPGALPVETLTGNIGGAVPPTSGNIDVIGAGGVTVSGDAGTSTLTITVSGSGFLWNEIVDAAANMATDNGYITNRATLVTLTLPLTAAVGTSLAVVGLGAGGWSIAQNAGQSIQIGITGSTVGVGGSVSSTNRYDSLQILCVVANTTWVVLGAPQGTLTVV